LSNLALDPILPRPQRPEPGSGRAGSSSAGAPSDRFDALLDTTPGDARRAAPEPRDRSRASDRRDDTRAPDRGNKGRTQDARPRDARATDRREAADDRGVARTEDGVKTQQDNATTGAAKDEPATATSGPTAVKAKPAADPAVVAQVRDQLAAAAAEATLATAGDPAAQPADLAAVAKAAGAEAASAVIESVPKFNKTDEAAATDNGAASPAATPNTGDPNAVAIQVAALAVAVNPLAAIDLSVGTASAAPSNTELTDLAPPVGGVAPVEAAGKPGAAAQASTASTAEQAGAVVAAAVGVDAKAAEPAQAETFQALAEAAGAKAPAGADAKADHAGKAKAAEHGKVAAGASPAQPSVTNGAQPAAANEQVAKPGATAQHVQPQAIEHPGQAAHQTASETRADTVTAAAGVQTGNNAPILPLNLAQPVALPLSTMFQVAAPKGDPVADAAVPLAGLAVEIVARAQDGGKRFDIRLDPPELGRVDVRLSVEDNGKVTSHLVVERAETLDLLRRDQPQLERALQQAGLNSDGGLQFSLRDQNSAQRDQTPRETPGTPQLIIPEDEAAAAEAARRGYGRLLGRAGGVDIRI